MTIASKPALPVYVLQYGDVGQVVRQLQAKLGLKPDGRFGQLTEGKVRQFQADKGLTVDGKAGPRTLGALGISVQLGMDVSHHQERINWGEVPAAMAWVAVKTTEGTTYVDPRAQENLDGARLQPGRQVLAYHFARPRNNPAAEAQHAARHCRGARLVLDLESTGDRKPAELCEWAQACLLEAEHLTGQRPALYTGAGFVRYQLDGGKPLAGWDLWLARYPGRRLADPGNLGEWPTWWVWQWSCDGKVPGVARSVDLNWIPTRG